ncbi:MAG: GNAT family N-acetyltransferase, partial [Bacteroidota bacterium]
MQIIEVKTKKQKKDFLQVPRIIYKDNPVWISHLDNDIEKVFDPARNKFFDFGIAVRFILYDKDNRLIGRIAAFINRHLAYTYQHPTGGIGFFECINDASAANLLFDTAKDWLEQRGMEAMDGPINFGEKDRFWGLLVEGFETPPPYLINYNPPYYRE